MNGDEMLTTKAVAAELGTTDRTVRSWCETGKLPAKKIGRQWRIPRTWLDLWVEGETARAVRQSA